MKYNNKMPVKTSVPAKPINFFESLSGLVVFSPESKSALLSAMQKTEFPKGHILVHAGEGCRSVYYIERGLSRTSYFHDGKDITEEFNAENSFACSINSYLTQQPDNRQIELLERSIIWSIPYIELEKLYLKYHEIERMGRLVMTMELVALQKRLSEIQFKSAHERYRIFVDENPSLLQRVHLGHLSSYLGITQETLSRIRSK